MEQEVSLQRNSTHTGHERGTGPKSKRRGIVDMYRAFDGSALMCIGVLLQALVTSRIDRAPPDMTEWESRLSLEQSLQAKRNRRRKKKIPEDVNGGAAIGKSRNKLPSEDEERPSEGEEDENDDESSTGSRQDSEDEGDVEEPDDASTD
ncbi:hypothetical protein FRC20_003398 [Serendipita sp. 405]|nr:hypothetical protein FRC20_003398 [Serendipita sp. 405]